MKRVTGKLSEVFCNAGKLSGFSINTKEGIIAVDVPDPLHVLIRNGPTEFYCGHMRETSVIADYAVVERAGVKRKLLRGMSF